MHSIKVEKLLEFVIASYLLAVGLLFVLNPSILEVPVYAAWRSFGANNWGACLLVTSLLHFGALLYNGRNTAISRPLRVLALFFHFIIAVQFGIFFIMGNAIWGTFTFWGLIGGILIILSNSVLTRHFTELKNGS